MKRIANKLPPINHGEILREKSFPGDLEIYTAIQAWSSAFQNRGESHGLAAIGCYARYALNELLSLSQSGHKESLRQLVEILTASVTDFDAFCRHELSHLPKNYTGKRHPDEMDVRDFARRKWVWPGLLSRDADLVKDNEELVTQLGLASEIGVSFSEKAKRMWTRKTPEVMVALRLRHIVNDYRTQFQFTNLKSTYPGYEQTANLAKTLAPLTRKNYAAWFKAAEPAFVKLYGEEFENHNIFAHYWKNSTYKDQPNARALIRSAIKKQIKQAFRSIAPKSSGVG